MGGGMAGMLVSSMLARHVGSVTVIDRDEFPTGPDLRKGVPQARHAHILWSGGARIVEELLPGTTDRLLGAGAHRIGIPDGQVSFTAYGWQHRFPEAQFMIACSRALLDWTVREETLREERIALVEKTEVLALLGDAGRVTGVRVRDQESGEEREVPADLVVDTTGRGHRRSGCWRSWDCRHPRRSSSTRGWCTRRGSSGRPRRLRRTSRW